MPEVHIDISEQSTHILEPIAEQNIRNTLVQLGMTNVIDDRYYIDYGYTTIKSRVRRSLDAGFNKDKVLCTVDINLKPSDSKINNYSFIHAPAYGITKNYYPNSKPILFDADSNIRIYEQTMPVTITTQYVFSLVSRSLAYSLTSRIKNRFGDGEIYDTKDVLFDYPLPPSFLKILFGLFCLKEDVDKTKYPLYLINQSNGRITIATDRNNRGSEVVVQATNVEAISVYNHDDSKPSEQKNRKVANSYEVRLNHTFQLSLPNNMSMEYPIVIDNNPVPPELIILDKSKPIRNLEQTSNISPWSNPQDGRIHQSRDAIKLPEYDDWIVPTQAPVKFFSYHEFFQSAFCLGEGAIQTFDILDEDSMGGHVFHPIVDHFLLLQGRESFQRDVLFNIAIYRDNRQLDPELCDMDFFGNISINTSDKSKIHRFVISELTDLKRLNPKWIEELLKWAEDYCTNYNPNCCPGLDVFDDLGKLDNGDVPFSVLRRIQFFIRACRPNFTKRRNLVKLP